MNRKVVLIAVAAAIIVLAGWYALLWSPSKSDLDKAKERTEAAESQEQQLQAQINRLRDVQRSEPLRRAQLETLRTAIPDAPNLGQFILDVNDAATRAGIRFLSIAPTEPRGTTTATTAATTTTTTGSGGTTTPTTAATTAPTASLPAEIGLTFQITGGYYQVLDFLNRIDRLPRLVVTDSINVSADQATGTLTVGVSARMFVRSIPAGFAGAPATTTSTTAAGGATTTTAPGGVTTTTAPGGTTTTSAGARP